MVDRTVQHSPADQALKRETRALIVAAGGQEEAAKHARRIKRHQTHSDYGAPNVDQFMPVDVVADLEGVTRGTPGWPRVTRALASRQNCAVVILPDAVPCSQGWMAKLGQLLKETNDISTRMCAALADGALCAADVRDHDLIAENYHLIELAVNLGAMFEQIAAEG